jgi:membrane protease subunit HflK
MQEVYSRSSKVILDTRGNNMIYVPIDQVIGNSSKAAALKPDAAAAATAAADHATPPTSVEPERMADRLRARREESR